MKIITHVAITALALLLAAHYIPGIHIDDLYAALIAACALGILNTMVRPILIILTLPITVLSLGLFILIINTSLFYFAGTLIQGFHVDSYAAAFLGSLATTIASTIGHKLV